MDSIVIAAVSFFVGATMIVTMVVRPLIKENQRLQKE